MTTTNQTISSANIDSQLERLESKYIETLEKTNQQLGLWTNPYGIMVGALSALFTVGAIIATILIWKQSKESQEKVNSIVKKQEDFLTKQEKLISERNVKARMLEETFDDLLSRYKSELKEIAEGTKDVKDFSKKQQEIEDAIKRLEEQKASLDASITSVNMVSPMSCATRISDGMLYGGNTFTLGQEQKSIAVSHTCSKCKQHYFGIVEEDNFFGTTMWISGEKSITCPSCKQRDKIMVAKVS